MSVSLQLVLCSCALVLTFSIVSDATFPIKIDEKLVVSKGKLQEFMANDEFYAIFYFTRMSSKLVTYVHAVAAYSFEADTHRIKFGMYDCSSETEEKECSRQTDGLQVSIYMKKNFVQNVDLISELSRTAHHHQLISSTLLKVKLIQLDRIDVIDDHSDLQSSLETSKKEKKKLVVLVVNVEHSAEHAEYLKLVNAIYSYYPGIRFAYTTKQNLIKTTENQFDMMGYLARMYLPRMLLYDCVPKSEKQQAVDECTAKLHPGLIEQASLSQMLNIITNVDELGLAIDLDIPYTVCFFDTVEEKKEIVKAFTSLDDHMYGVTVKIVAARIDERVLSLLPKAHERVTNGLGAECYIYEVDMETVTRNYVKLEELQPALKKMIRASQARFRARQAKKWRDDQNKMDPGDSHYENSDADDEIALIEAVETQDDELAVLEESMGGRKLLRLKNVKVLTRDTWDSSSYSGLVMFHLNRYDHRSRIVLRIYDEIAADISTPEFATLDCHDWTDVCRHHNVTAFPLIRAYKKGKMTQYSGDMSMDGLKRLAYLYKYDSPENVISLSEMRKYNEEITALKMKPVFGCFKSKKDKEYKEFRRAAKQLFGQRLFVASTVSDFSKNVAMYLKLGELPAVGLFDPETRTAEKLDNKMLSAVFVENYGLRSAYDKFPSVTPQNMIHIVDQSVPQVFLFTNDLNEPISQAVKAVAEKGQSGYGMSYLDMNAPINQKIHVEMIPKDSDISLPTVLIVKYKTGDVFELSKTGLEKLNSKDLIQHISKWLIAVGERLVPTSSKLAKGDWKPKHPGYDFLAMIEKEKRINQQKEAMGRLEGIKSRVAKVNEEKEAKSEDQDMSVEKPLTNVDMEEEGEGVLSQTASLNGEANKQPDSAAADLHVEL